MDTPEGYRRIDPALVTRLSFRSVDARQMEAIREKLAAANLGGLILQAETLPSADSVTEVLFRVAPQTPLLSGVGLVMRVEQPTREIAVRLLRMVVAEQAADTPAVTPAPVPAPGAPAAAAEPVLPGRAATRIFQEVGTITVIGDFNAKATEAFNAAWQKALSEHGAQMIIDLTRVQRISSMAIGLLVSAQMDAMQVSRTLTVRVPATLERIFRVSRVDKVLRFIYVNDDDADADSAVAAAPNRPAAPPDTQTYLRQIEERERSRKS